MVTGAEDMVAEAEGVNDEPPSRRQRIMALERCDGMLVASLEQLAIPSTRTEANIVKSRADHIKYLVESKSVKNWDYDTAVATRALILSGRFVDDAHKEKSRYCARDFATTKDPTVFAAASDVDVAAVVDLFAVKRNYPTMCIDAVAGRRAGACLLAPPEGVSRLRS